MRRVDVQPTEQDLIELIESNPIDRNADLASMLELLDTIEGAYTIFLDAEWGSGKTYFVKQLKLILEELNPQLESRERLGKAIVESADLNNAVASGKSSINESTIPIYYNAWENDYWEDPLPSLIQALAGDFDANSDVRQYKSSRDILVSIVDRILERYAHGLAREVSEAINGTSLLESYKQRLLIRDSIEELVETVLPENANRLLLIIDELDRCKPTFALKLLEEIKNLFSSDRVVTIVSVNTTQLGHAVCGFYGPGFDGQRYLLRFYDSKVVLRKENSKAYFRSLGVPYDIYKLHVAAHEMVESLGMTLRDMGRYSVEIAEVDRKRKDKTRVREHSGPSAAFAEASLVPVLLAVRLMRPEDYQRIAVGRDAALLLQYLSMSDDALGSLDSVWGYFTNSEDQPQDDEGLASMRLKYLQGFCELLWNPDAYSGEYLEARQLLLGGVFDTDDLRYVEKYLLH